MIGRKGNAGFSVPVPQLKCLLIGTRNPGKFRQKTLARNPSPCFSPSCPQKKSKKLFDTSKLWGKLAIRSPTPKRNP